MNWNKFDSHSELSRISRVVRKLAGILESYEKEERLILTLLSSYSIWTSTTVGSNFLCLILGIGDFGYGKECLLCLIIFCGTKP